MLVKKEEFISVISTVADVTDLLRNQEVQRKSNEIGKIGFWEVDLVHGTNPIWSFITKTIHEVGPNYEPTFDSAVNFYK